MPEQFPETPKSFTFQNRQEVEVFEKYLDEYMKGLTAFSPKHISLASSYDQLQQRSDGGKIFAALFDIQLSLMLLELDFVGISGTWNKYFSLGKLEGGSILDSRGKFFGKMEIHRHSTSYVLRYRAIWDKIMGFLILLFSPEDYKSFEKADSRKKSFKRIAANINEIPNELIQQIEVFITLFDNSFRTAEAHGTGVLRKSNFLMNEFLDSPTGEFLGYHNLVNEIIAQVGKSLQNLDSPLPLSPVKIRAIGNYINLVSKKTIQIYTEDLSKQENLKSCTIAYVVLSILERLKSSSSISMPLNIPELMEKFQIVVNGKIPKFFEKFFNTEFWFDSSRSVLNYAEAWELDKEIFSGALELPISPRGLINPAELDNKEKAMDYAIGLVAAIAANDMSQKLDIPNILEDGLKRLLQLAPQSERSRVGVWELQESQESISVDPNADANAADNTNENQ